VTEFSSELRAEIARRFSAQTPAPGEGNQVATFKCASGGLGDVIVEADGADAAVTVYIVGMTHRHFDEALYDTPAEIVEAVYTFLADLFDGQVVVWVAADGGSSGWFYRYDKAGRAGLPRDARAGTWDGPYRARIRDLLTRRRAPGRGFMLLDP